MFGWGVQIWTSQSMKTPKFFLILLIELSAKMKILKTVLSGLPASPEITVSGLGLRLELELLLRRQGCQAEAQPSDHSLRAGAQTGWSALELVLRSQGCQAVAQAWIQ